jgi:hypothetical protein
MMLDGTFCEGCGVYMGDAIGFARLCRGCAEDRKAAGHKVRGTGLGGWQDLGPRPEPPKAKVRCPICNRKVWPNGLADHQRDAHGVVAPQ